MEQIAYFTFNGSREGLDVSEETDPDGGNYALGLAKLRVDGFVSLDAGPTRRGILVTRPLISEGRRLTRSPATG